MRLNDADATRQDARVYVGAECRCGILPHCGGAVHQNGACATRLEARVYVGAECRCGFQPHCGGAVRMSGCGCNAAGSTRLRLGDGGGEAGGGFLLDLQVGFEFVAPTHQLIHLGHDALLFG